MTISLDQRRRLPQQTLSHDPAGNVASLTDIGNTVLSYSYDSSGRLTGATDTAAGSFGILGYSYDPNGNHLAETRNASTLPYVYSPPNWLYQKGSDTRTQTASGNTASSTAIGSFTYDGFNRLATSVTAAETTTYTYNALGERTKKINQNGLSTVFHYGPNGELLYERDANGNTKVYVWLDGRPLARIDNDAQIYYYHVDHLGTPQAMTNSAGATVWKADYEPFGKATVKVSTIENNLRFPGQYYDRETGLHYNYFRDYDPTTGRYVEADPIGLEGGMNLYSYAGGNPLGFVDPLGLWSISFEGYVGLGGGIIFGRDSNTGQPFITLRGGYGIGGGFEYDPLATRPGSEECNPGQESNPSGEAIGLFGKVGGRLGPVKGGLSANAGLQNGASAFPVNPYGSFVKPKISFTNRGTGISASAAAGAEFTIYGKGSCGCPK